MKSMKDSIGIDISKTCQGRHKKSAGFVETRRFGTLIRQQAGYATDTADLTGL